MIDVFIGLQFVMVAVLSSPARENSPYHILNAFTPIGCI